MAYAMFYFCLAFQATVGVTCSNKVIIIIIINIGTGHKQIALLPFPRSAVMSARNAAFTEILKYRTDQ